MMHTLDGFIFVGTDYRELNKYHVFEGVKFLGHRISFKIHTEKSENCCFIGTGIPVREKKNIVPISGSIPRNACVACET